MHSQIETDIQFLHTLQRRILSVQAENPQVRKCLDSAYSGAKQAIEALDELDLVLCKLTQKENTER